MQLAVSQKTDTGLKRRNNQDNMMYIDQNHFKLFVVADGMGGYSGGEIASEIAISSIKSTFENKGENLFKPLKYSITQANRNIYMEASKNPEKYKGMGTTVVALAIKNNKAYIAHVGDSRIYLHRNNSLMRLTRDHSKIQRMIDSGIIHQKDAQNHPEANIITRALGINTGVNIEVPNKHIDIQINDIFLLCSDGLCGKISDESIEAVFNHKNHVDDICEQLFQKALDAGGDDNITVQLIQVESLDSINKKTKKNSKEKKTIMNWIKKNMFAFIFIILAGLLVLNYTPMNFFQSAQDEMQSILNTPVKIPKINEVKKQADDMMDNI